MITHYQVHGTQDDRPPELQVDVTTVYIRSNIERVENDEFVGWVYDEVQYSKDEYMSLLADKEELNQIEVKLLNPDERYMTLDKSSILLEDLKKFKQEQLSFLCTQTILGRFKATIDDIEYEFSYDTEAQLRFIGTKALLADNTIAEIEWTAYLNGERVRIILNKDNFNNVQLPALHHQNSNIVRYNQLLQQVMSATTIEEVDLINW